MSSLNEYDFGQTVKVSGQFKVDDVLTDPTTITLTVITPAGVSTDYTYAAAQVTKDATGVYSKSVVGNEVGEWIYKWTGTGAVAAVGQARFAVRRANA